MAPDCLGIAPRLGSYRLSFGSGPNEEDYRVCLSPPVPHHTYRLWKPRFPTTSPGLITVQSHDSECSAILVTLPPTDGGLPADDGVVSTTVTTTQFRQRGYVFAFEKPSPQGNLMLLFATTGIAPTSSFRLGRAVQPLLREVGCTLIYTQRNWRSQAAMRL